MESRRGAHMLALEAIVRVMVSIIMRRENISVRLFLSRGVT